MDFRAEIQSGDHFRILAQLKHTALLISYILFERNKGLGQLLDNSRNDRFKQRLAATEARELRNRVPADTTQLYASLQSLGKGIAFDRDIFINRITNRIRNFDVDYALDVDLNVNRYTFVDRYANLNIFRFLDVDRNLFNHFDKVAAIRFVDRDYNPQGDVTVEIETAVYAVVAVAVFVAAVAVLVVGHGDVFNDRGGLLAEQLVNTVAERFKARVDIRSNRPYR